MIGVEQWAEIRRLYFVEKRSKRAIHRLTGAHRDTITRALISDQPPRYERASRRSKLDPFREWICEQLRADPSIQSLRLREMAVELGYEGGKSIFDDYVREVRPRFQVRRTFQRTVYRPGGVGAVRSVGAAGVDSGWSRAVAPRICRDRRVVLVTGDRRQLGLLQGGA